MNIKSATLIISAMALSVSGAVRPAQAQEASSGMARFQYQVNTWGSEKGPKARAVAPLPPIMHSGQMPTRNSLLGDDPTVLAKPAPAPAPVMFRPAPPAALMTAAKPTFTAPVPVTKAPPPGFSAKFGVPLTPPPTVAQLPPQPTQPQADKSVSGKLKPGVSSTANRAVAGRLLSRHNPVGRSVGTPGQLPVADYGNMGYSSGHIAPPSSGSSGSGANTSVTATLLNMKKH